MAEISIPAKSFRHLLRAFKIGRDTVGYADEAAAAQGIRSATQVDSRIVLSFDDDHALSTFISCIEHGGERDPQIDDGTWDQVFRPLLRLNA